jgi:hypothetical protein
MESEGLEKLYMIQQILLDKRREDLPRVSIPPSGGRR